jgi:hypothetical protein
VKRQGKAPSTSFKHRPALRWFALALGLVVSLWASSATHAYGAAPTHPFLEGLSKTGFNEPCGVAVDSAGDLYVAAYGDDSVKVYDPAGGLLSEFTPAANAENPCALAVDSSGAVYVNGWGTDVVRYRPDAFPPVSGTSYEADSSLGGNGTLVAAGATSVAVDPATQNVYVAQGDHISSYEPDGTPISDQIGKGVAGAFFYGVDVDGESGNVYVTDTVNTKAYILDPSGSQILAETDGSDSEAGPFGTLIGAYLAVDQSNGHVYVSNVRGNGVVDEFDAAGHFVSQISHGFSDAEPTDIAVDNSAGANAGSVYVTSGASSGGSVFAFGPLTYGAQPPTAVTAGAEQVTQSSAVLTGLANPGGGSTTDCHFEWGPAAGEYTSGTAPCEPDPGAAGDGVAVSAEATGLTAHTTYHYRLVITTAAGSAQGEDAGFVASAPPSATTKPASSVGNTEATLNASVNPNGGADGDCRFQYVSELAFQSTGYTDLSSGGTAACVPDPGSATSPVLVSAQLDNLVPGTAYRFRVVETTDGGSAEGQSEQFATSSRPLVETTGSPVRTATTARLEARVDPFGVAASYHFEYGAGPCSVNSCTATESHSAGVGNETRFVSQWITGLQPDTTYHYRVVADNGNPDGPSFGEDMTLTTLPSDVQLNHGRFPGPPGSDRAYEQVSIPDSGGNPVNVTWAISPDGDRVIYSLAGGSPASTNGTAASKLYAQRTAGGWHSSSLSPPRGTADTYEWLYAPSSDFSRFVGFAVGEALVNRGSLWRIAPGTDPAELFPAPSKSTDFFAISDDASRVVTAAKGSFDPAHPTPTGYQIFDVSSGTPHLLSLMPDGSTPSCGVKDPEANDFDGLTAYAGTQQHWLSADGSVAFFPSKGDACNGPTQLYMRDIEAGETRLVSGPTVSGPTCSSGFLRSTPDAVFFWTPTRLVADDTEPPLGACGAAVPSDGDVYRYDLGSGELRCVTCVALGRDADVPVVTNAPGASLTSVAVAANGSRVYFRSFNQLLPGASIPGIYRVEVGSGDLAYVAPAASVDWGGAMVGANSAVSADGSTLVFRGSGSGLNALGGSDNGGTRQYYRYDDRDRSLVCVSCPTDGSAPRAGVSGRTSTSIDTITNGVTYGGDPLSADGSLFAFTTPTALDPADQNTARPGADPATGTDVYEWRDGRLLLVSDGLTKWPVAGQNLDVPGLAGVSPSGRDIFFSAAAQYTHDALDGYDRLYDARIGGGFEPPISPQPCPLEVCQGIPKGAPEEQSPSTGKLQRSGNLPRRHARHGKHRRKHAHRRHHHHRRTAR